MKELDVREVLTGAYRLSMLDGWGTPKDFQAWRSFSPHADQHEPCLFWSGVEACYLLASISNQAVLFHLQQSRSREDSTLGQDDHSPRPADLSQDLCTPPLTKLGLVAGSFESPLILLLPCSSLELYTSCASSDSCETSLMNDY